VTQPEVIYAHARNLTSLLKMPLNVGLQEKCSRLIENRSNRSRRIHFRLLPEVALLTEHAETLSSQKSPKMVSRARNDRVSVGKRVR